MNSNTAIESKHYLHSEVIDLIDLRLPPPSIHSGFNNLISLVLISVNCPQVAAETCRAWFLWRESSCFCGFNESCHGCCASCEDHQTRHFLSGFMYEFLRQWNASANSAEFCKVPIILWNKQTKSYHQPWKLSVYIPLETREVLLVLLSLQLWAQPLSSESFLQSHYLQKFPLQLNWVNSEAEICYELDPSH